MIGFKFLDKRANADHLGLIPAFFSESDPRPAYEQINERYAHGGGWSPMKEWVFIPASAAIKYPGDVAYKPLAEARLHDSEMIYVYQNAWVAIVQQDGSYEVARID